MDGIQAAVLQIKLRHLEKGNQLRRSHAAHYGKGFQSIEEVITPEQNTSVRHVYHIYAIRVSNRDQVMHLLAEQGIGSGVHYPVPIHLQEAYRSLRYQPGSFPVAERCATEFVSLPMFPELTPEQVERVIEAVNEAVESEIGSK